MSIAEDCWVVVVEPQSEAVVPPSTPASVAKLSPARISEGFDKPPKPSNGGDVDKAPRKFGNGADLVL